MGRGGRQKEGVLVEGEGREEVGQEKGREGREAEGGVLVEGEGRNKEVRIGSRHFG